MDKRQEKTRQALYQALRDSLTEEPYEKISVSELLKRSGVSRSAFYAHFKGKDDVLKSVAEDIFDHVFSPTKAKEAGHDFSTSSNYDYKRLIAHIFYHFYEERDLLSAIFRSSASEPFSNILKRHSSPFLEAAIRSRAFYKEGVPLGMQTHQLTESFASLLRHWVLRGCEASPEEMAEYFVLLYS